MDNTDDLIRNVPWRLVRSWTRSVVVSVLIATIGFFGVGMTFSFNVALYWLVPTALVTATVHWLTGRSLDLNHPKDDPQLRLSIGIPNWITVLRGTAVGILAGFVLVDAGRTELGWIPAVLYGAAVICDYADGFTARLLERRSELGAYLDGEVDALAVLVASVLVARIGVLGAWFVLVGLARYVFVAAEWVRERWVGDNRPLKPSRASRAAAGLQMGFMTAALCPVVNVQYIRWAAPVFSAFFFACFFKDWLLVSGAAGRHAWLYSAVTRVVERIIIPWGGVVIRVAAALLGFRDAMMRTDRWWEIAVAGITSAAVAGGVFGRFAATALLVFLILGSGISLPSTLLLAATMIVGTGRLTVWAPEYRIFAR